MKQKVKIKEADISELEEISKIESSSIENGWSKALLEKEFFGENKIILSAVLNGNIIGFINGSFVLDEGEILNVAVAKEHRREGVGSELLQAFFEKMKEKKIKKLYLEVRESNKSALSLYKNNGFLRKGLRKNYYKNPSENGIIMEKILI